MDLISNLNEKSWKNAQPDQIQGNNHTACDEFYDAAAAKLKAAAAAVVSLYTQCSTVSPMNSQQSSKLLSLYSTTKPTVAAWLSGSIVGHIYAAM